MKYRPDIDGLRAIAVVPVVLFHLGAPFIRGGFVGVDVFFVISGYLITKVIFGELVEGRFSIAGFYERRIRRIFPALFAMLITSWLLAASLMMPVDLHAFSRTLAAASLSVSNFQFWSEAGYFDGPSELKPLLHTWSLAVEEQFYVVFPLLLIGLRRWFPAYLRLCLWTLALISLGLGVWYLDDEAEMVFFLLPFRAWELLLGSLLALEAVPAVARPMLREGLALTGLAAIAGSMVLFSEKTPFPGVAALAPALGASLIIFTGMGAPTLVSRVLSWRPIVAIGLISYSIYLWHWPMIVFSRYYAPNEPSAALLACLGGLSLLAGWASWRWIEQPFRQRLAPGARRKVLLSGAGVTVLGLLLGSVGIVTEGWPSRLSPVAQHYAQMLDKRIYFGIYDRGHCFLDYRQRANNYRRACSQFQRPSEGKLRVLIFGDSFAAHLYPGLKAQSELDVRQYTATSCRPLVAGVPRCDAIYHHFFSKVVKRSTADVVVVSGKWHTMLTMIGKAKFTRRLGHTLHELHKAKKRVVLVGQSPVFYKEVARVLAVRRDLQGLSKASLEAESMVSLNRLLQKIARQQSAEFFDPFQEACEGTRCLVAVDGEPLYWDEGHMTLAGSLYQAGPLTRLLLGGNKHQ